jgi:hypothetical protein
MCVSKSGRHFVRRYGLCESWWTAGIYFGKGVEFYSVGHFVHNKSLHKSSVGTGMRVNDLTFILLTWRKW